MRILNAEPRGYSSDARRILRQLGQLHEEECDRARLLELIPDVEVLIVRLGHRVDREVLKRGSRLRVVVTATTGLNHIDLIAAEERGVQVLSLKGEREFLEGITATAELTWGLLLNLLRRILDAQLHVRQGGWDRDSFRGTQLKGKALGVVGLGRLGSIVADYGRAFRMDVLACDPNVTEAPSWIEKVNLAELLSRSDVVTLHVNLDASTRRFFDRHAFSLMKPGAVLINTSRGELIDETALLEFLDSGRLNGAALDVLTGEVDNNRAWPRDSAVWRYAKTHNNLILTPHIGGSTQESLSEAETYMAEKLKRYFQKEA